jgi:hypothetical protein
MRDWVLIYGMKVIDLEGFTDADGTTLAHGHAIMGYTFLISRRTFSGSSKKQ